MHRLIIANLTNYIKIQNRAIYVFETGGSTNPFTLKNEANELFFGENNISKKGQQKKHTIFCNQTAR